MSEIKSDPWAVVLSTIDGQIAAAEAEASKLRAQRTGIVALREAFPDPRDLLQKYGGFGPLDSVPLVPADDDARPAEITAPSSVHTHPFGDLSRDAIARKLIQDNNLIEFRTKTITELMEGAGYSLENAQVSNALSALVRKGYIVSTPENGKGTWKRVDLDPVPAATDSTAEAAPSALTSSPVPAGAKPE